MRVSASVLSFRDARSVPEIAIQLRGLQYYCHDPKRYTFLQQTNHSNEAGMQIYEEAHENRRRNRKCLSYAV